MFHDGHTGPKYAATASKIRSRSRRSLLGRPNLAITSRWCDGYILRHKAQKPRRIKARQSSVNVAGWVIRYLAQRRRDFCGTSWGGRAAWRPMDARTLNAPSTVSTLSLWRSETTGPAGRSCGKGHFQLWLSLRSMAEMTSL